MTTSPRLVLLRAYPNAALAQIAVDALAAHDITAHVEGANRVGALGVEAVSVRVLVDAADEARARDVLADGDPPSSSANAPSVDERAARAEGPHEPWRPSRMLVVTIASLLLAAALAAALLAKTRELDALLAHNRFGPAYIEGACGVSPWAGTATKALAQCDLDGDGVAETIRQHNRRGDLVHEAVDADADGTAEQWRNYDAAGAVIATALDADEDGRPERIHWHDKHGGIVGTSDDRDGDARMEVTVEPHAGGGATTWHDDDGDALQDRLELRDAHGVLVQELVKGAAGWHPPR